MRRSAAPKPLESVRRGIRSWRAPGPEKAYFGPHTPKKTKDRASFARTRNSSDEGMAREVIKRDTIALTCHLPVL